MFKNTKISKYSKSIKNCLKNSKRQKIKKIRRKKSKNDRKTSFGSMKDELSLESIESQISFLEKKDQIFVKKSKKFENCENLLKKSNSENFENDFEKKNQEKNFFQDFQICSGFFFLSKKIENLEKEVKRLKKILVVDK